MHSILSCCAINGYSLLSMMLLYSSLFFEQIIRTVKGRGNQAETSKSWSGGGGSSDGTMHLVHENETLKVCHSFHQASISQGS